MSATTAIARRRADEGFTLIELVLAVAILGIISTALFGIVLSYLKTSVSASSRLTESTDQQFVSTYWQADVSSLGTRATFDPEQSDPVPPTQSVWISAPPPGGCGAGVGTAVVGFTWTEFKVGADAATAWNFTAQEVAYVAVGPNSQGQYVLKRVRCKAGVAGEPITVARSLTAVPVATCEPSCNPAGSLPDRVSLKIDVRNLDDPRSVGYTTTLVADRRQG